MKILHIMGWYVPGMGYQENYLPAAQKKLNNEVVILTSNQIPKHGGFNNTDAFNKIRNLKIGVSYDHEVKIIRLPSIYFKNQIFFLGLESEIDKFMPDAIHAHGTTMISTIQVLHIKNKKDHFKLFIDDHSHSNNFIFYSFIQKLYLKFVNYIINKNTASINCFLPVTPSSKNILINKHNFTKGNIVILNLGADRSIFYKSDLLRRDGRKKFNVREDQKCIIYAGKIDESKEIPCLIGSMVEVVNKIPDAILLIVGFGNLNYMDYLNSLVISYKLTKNIKIIDFISHKELPCLYNAADIGVWPGDHSITVLEAISAGLPVIVPLDDSAYGVISELGNLLQYERGNENSLAIQIINMLVNDDLRAKISNFNDITGENLLSWDKIAMESLKIYKEY